MKNINELLKKIELFEKLAQSNNPNDPNYTSNLIEELSKKLTFLQSDLKGKTNNWTKGLTSSWQEDDKNLYHFSSSPEYVAIQKMMTSTPKQISEFKEQQFMGLNDAYKQTIVKAYFELKK